ncbi:MAG: ATP-binding protein [Chitinispirillaceae bacterium]|nr:ATP-binding protein [Chitinispirillaceae bacterium]
MKEIVIISGKGGTGKTSITASFAALAKGTAVLADCDVDAADLHLILEPRIHRSTPFISGHTAVVNREKCTGCGTCNRLCRFGALGQVAGSGTWRVDPVACEGCGVCVRFCPAGAIDFRENRCGDWFVSDTRFGTMVHAKLGIAAENSGRLVTLVRTEARRFAEEQHADYVLIDGSPGIGCPVIASLTAAQLAFIVIEPTVSGLHDLRRIAGLTRQLRVPTMVCVNKWDINPSVTESIRAFTETEGMQFAGTVRYDRVFTDAQRKAKTVVECSRGPVSEDIIAVWMKVNLYLQSFDDRSCITRSA